MIQQSPILTKSLFAATLVAAFTLPCLTGCANDAPEAESSTETTVGIITTAEAETESFTEAVTETATEAATVTTTQKPTETTTEKDNTPKTKAEIAAYVNTAFATTKREAKSVTNTYLRGSNYQNIVDVGNSVPLESTLQSLMKSLLKEEHPNKSYTGAEIASAFPPANAKAALTADAIKTASCQKSGSKYIIKITVKPDVSPKPGSGSGAFCNILTPNQITDPVPPALKIRNVKCSYDGASCELHVDIATGRILYLSNNMPLVLSVDALAMKNCRIGLQFEEKWTVQY